MRGGGEADAMSTGSVSSSSSFSSSVSVGVGGKRKRPRAALLDLKRVGEAFEMELLERKQASLEQVEWLSAKEEELEERVRALQDKEEKLGKVDKMEERLDSELTVLKTREKGLVIREEACERDLAYLERNKAELIRLRKMESDLDLESKRLNKESSNYERLYKDLRHEQAILKEERAAFETQKEADLAEFKEKQENETAQRTKAVQQARLDLDLEARKLEAERRALETRAAEESESIKKEKEKLSKECIQVKRALEGLRRREKQLEGKLKDAETVKTEIETRLAQIESREASIERAQSTLRCKESEIAAREKALVEKGATHAESIRLAQRELADARAEWEAAIAREKQQMDERHSKLITLEQEVDAKSRQTESHAARISNRERELQKLKSLSVQVSEEQFKIHAATEQLKTRSEKLEQERSDFRAERGTCEELWTKISSLQTRLTQALAQVDRSEGTLAKEKSIQGRWDELEAKAEQLSAREHELEVQASALQAKASELERVELQRQSAFERAQESVQVALDAERAAEEAQERAFEAEKEYKLLYKELQADRVKAASLNDAQLELERLKSELEETRAQLERRGARLSQDKQALQDKKAQLLAREKEDAAKALELSRMESKLASDRKELEHEADICKQKLQGTKREIEQAQAALAETKRQEDRVKRDVQAAQTELQVREQQIRSRTADLNDREEGLAKREQAIAAAKATMAQQQLQLKAQCDEWQKEQLALQQETTQTVYELAREREKVQRERDTLDAMRKKQEMLEQSNHENVRRESAERKRVSEEHTRDLEQIQAERARLLALRQQLERERQQLEETRGTAQVQLASSRVAGEALARRDEAIAVLQSELKREKLQMQAEREFLRIEAEKLSQSRAGIQARATEFQKWQEKLGAIEHRLETREQESAVREADLDAQLTKLAERMAEADQRFKELADKERECSALSESAQRFEAELGARARDLESSEASIAKRETDVQSTRLQLDAQREQLYNAARRLEKEQQEFMREQTSALEERVRRVEQTLAERARGLEERERELTQRQETLDANSKALNDQVAWLESEQSERDAKRQELNSVQEQLETDLRQLNQAREAFKNRELELAKHQASLEFATKRLAEREERHNAKRDKDRRAAAKMVERLENCAHELGTKMRQQKSLNIPSAAPEVSSLVDASSPPMFLPSTAPPLSAQTLLEQLNTLRKRQDADWKQDLDDLDRAQKAMERRLQEQALDMADRQRKELLKAQDELVSRQEKGQRHILEKLEDVIALAEEKRTNGATALESESSAFAQKHLYDEAIKSQAAVLETQRKQLFTQLATERHELEERQKEERRILEIERLELERRAKSERESIEKERADLLKREEAIVENLSVSAAEQTPATMSRNKQEQENDPQEEQSRAYGRGATAVPSNASVFTKEDDESNKLVSQALDELAQEKKRFQEEVAARQAQHESDRESMRRERERIEAELERHRKEIEAKLEHGQSVLGAKWDEFSQKVQASLEVSKKAESPIVQRTAPESSTNSNAQTPDEQATKSDGSTSTAHKALAPIEKGNGREKLLPTSPVLEFQSMTPLLVARARAKREELALAILEKEMQQTKEREGEDFYNDALSSSGDESPLDANAAANEADSAQKSESIPSPDLHHNITIEADITVETMILDAEDLEQKDQMVRNQLCFCETLWTKGQTLLTSSKSNMNRLHRLAKLLIPFKSDGLTRGIGEDVCTLSVDVVSFQDQVSAVQNKIQSTKSPVESATIQAMESKLGILLNEELGIETRFKDLVAKASNLMQLDEQRHRLLTVVQPEEAREADFADNIDESSSMSLPKVHYHDDVDGPSSYRLELEECLEGLEKSLKARNLLMQRACELTPSCVSYEGGSHLLQVDDLKTFYQHMETSKPSEKAQDDPSADMQNSNDGNAAKDEETTLTLDDDDINGDVTDLFTRDLDSGNNLIEQQKRALNLKLQRLGLQLAMIEADPSQTDAGQKEALQTDFKRVQLELAQLLTDDQNNEKPI